MLSRAMADDAALDNAHEPLLPYATAPPLSPSGKRSNKRTPKCVRWLAVATFAVVAFIVLHALAKIPVRKIATSSMRDARMEIVRMRLTRPNATNVTLNITLSLHSPSAFSVQIDPTRFDLLHESADELHTVGSLDAPAMDVASGDNAIAFPASLLSIDNRTAWDAFARDMIARPNVTYTLDGALTIRIRLLWGLIAFDLDAVPFRKTLLFQGMDGMKTMRIAGIDMTASTPTRVVAKIRTCLYNPSITTLHPVGKLCLRAFYPTVSNHTLVAKLATAENASIDVGRSDASHPECAAMATHAAANTAAFGYNLLELEGEMLGTNEAAISGLISNYLSHTPSALTVVACESQATSVELYNHAMQSLAIPATLPPQQESLIGRMFFNRIALDAPEKGRENTHLGLTTAVAVEATSPLGANSPLTLSEIHMRVKLFARKRLDEVYLGELSTVHVDILDGRLVERRNISVNCSTSLLLDARGAAFGDFVRDSVVKDAVDLRLEGHLDVVAHGALNTLRLTSLPIDVTTSLLGMNDFRNVSIVDFALPGQGDARDRGEAMTTDISIWNPSLFAVSIGVLEMRLQVASTNEALGSLRGQMSLAPGANHLEMAGKLVPKLDAAGRVSDAVAGFFSNYLRGVPSNIAVVITASEYPDCIWMRNALVGLEIRTVFPGVVPGFQLISDINMTRLDVVLQQQDQDNAVSGRTPLPVTTNTQVLIRTSLTARVKMPASIRIPLDITNLSIALTMRDDVYAALGSLVSAREACAFNQTDDGAFSLNMSRFYSIGFGDNDQVTAMAGFISELLTQQGGIVMRLTSDAQAHEGAFPFVETRMGMLPLQNVPIDGAPVIAGMNSFRDPPVRVLAVDIERGLRTSMVLSMTFAIRNPSVVQTALGDLRFAVRSAGAQMGVAQIQDFELKCCGVETVLRGRFEFAPAAADLLAAQRFLSNFVSGYFTNGDAQQIEIQGSRESSALDLLQPALASLTMPSTLPTLAHLFPSTPALVTSSVLYTPSIFHLSQIPTALKLQNPFSESITVTAVDLELYPCEDQTKVDGALVCKKYYNDPLARFAPTQFAPMFVPANSNGCYSCCQGARCEQKMPLCPRASAMQCMHADVGSFFSPEAIAALLRSATSGLLMKVNGTIGTSIGEYVTHLWYQQDGLLVAIAT